MSLRLKACTPADFPKLVDTERLAFADNPFTPILFPGPFPPGIAEFRVQELAASLEDSTTFWLKVRNKASATVIHSTSLQVVDTASEKPDEGVAFAKWNVYKDAPPSPSLNRSFGEGCNIPACEALAGWLAERRGKLLSDTKCVCKSFSTGLCIESLEAVLCRSAIGKQKPDADRSTLPCHRSSLSRSRCWRSTCAMGCRQGERTRSTRVR